MSKKSKETSRERTRAFLRQYLSSTQSLESLKARRKTVEERGGDNAELLRQIEEQTDICNRNMLKVQSLLARFPAGSRKFNVMAMKYLDGANWLKISNKLYLSESAVRKLETQAVDELSVFLE